MRRSAAIGTEVWTDQEIQHLNSTFSNDDVDYNLVKERCQTIDMGNRSPRQLYDKLRSLGKVRQSPSKRHCLFSEEELHLLTTRGKKVIQGGPINLDRVTEVLGGTGLLEQYSFVQIRTRLTYERQKLKKKMKR